MKHILNDLSNEEKNSIREQHSGGMKVVTENFSRLLNSKLGDSKPLVAEQSSGALPTVSNIQEWKVAAKFFKDQYVLNKLDTSVALGQYLYVSEPTGKEGGFNVSIYQAQPANEGMGLFIIPQLLSNISTDGSGNLKGDTEMRPMRNLKNVNKSNGAEGINSNWNSIPQTAEQEVSKHIKLRKPALKPTIDQIKQRSDLSELGKQLVGNAKTAYNEIII